MVGKNANFQNSVLCSGIFLQHEFALATRRTTKLTDIFQLVQPDDVQLTFKGITTYMNSMFIFQLKQNMNRNEKNTTIKPLSLKGMTFFQYDNDGEEGKI